MLVFDLWIGNWDRTGNFKANISEAPHPLLIALDHANALLSFGASPEASIEDLGRGTPGAVRQHPFGGLVRFVDAAPWMARVQATHPDRLRECCVMGGTVGGITTSTQIALADALLKRRDALEELVQAQTT